MNPDRRRPASILDLDTPALCIEASILERNLARMQALANQYRLKLRPHVKTHKCIALAQRQLALGAVGIAVAKLGEAEIMCDGGITDIQIANQIVGPQKIARLRQLARKCRVSCAVDAVEQIGILATAFSADHPLRVFIEINCGLNRAGVSTALEARALFQRIAAHRGLICEGLLTHAGHAYAAASPGELADIGRREGEDLVEIAATLRRDGFSIPVISVGSTPTAGYVASIPGVTELRVGNYIFNDMTQVALGVASLEDCAMTVLATVTSRPSSDRAVIDCGSKSLALDRGAHGTTSLAGYGQLVGFSGVLSRLSEEHGMIEKADPGLIIGDRVRIIPNHSCPVANLFEHMYVVDGPRILDRLAVDARGCTQ